MLFAGWLERNSDQPNEISMDFTVFEVLLLALDLFSFSELQCDRVCRCLLPTVDQQTGIKDPDQEPWKTLRT